MFGLVKVPRSVWIAILADLTSLLYQIQIKENCWVSWLPPAPWQTVVHIPPGRLASRRATVAVPQVWDSHTGTLYISSLDTRVLKKLKRIHMLAASLLSSETNEVLYKHGLKLRQTNFQVWEDALEPGQWWGLQDNKGEARGEVWPRMHTQETFICELINKWMNG